MNTFNIIANAASIMSLIVSIIVLKGVYNVKSTLKITDKSQTKINQKAKGRDIQQTGGNRNA